MKAFLENSWTIKKCRTGESWPVELFLDLLVSGVQKTFHTGDWAGKTLSRERRTLQKDWGCTSEAQKQATLSRWFEVRLHVEVSVVPESFEQVRRLELFVIDLKQKTRNTASATIAGEWHVIDSDNSCPISLLPLWRCVLVVVLFVIQKETALVDVFVGTWGEGSGA